MSKNKLLIAIAAGLFTATAATGAFAQTSSGNSSGNDTSAAAPDNSAPTTTHKKQKTHKHSHTANKRTPAAETGNGAGAESGQSK